jgi:glycosyltransferase involved in cell wall biosynthesis
LSVPAIAVVIPTYNRAATLLIALDHLARQTFRDFEVVVCDDGSTDETQASIARFAASAPFPILSLRQENSGAARARNHAITRVTAPLTVLIGDDIFAAPDFLRLHVELHRQHPEREAVALGLTRWCDQRQVVTPLMRWLANDGIQFAYGALLAGAPPTWEHFYTSNLSLKTAYLREHPFREGFPGYGMEDIELGYRLARKHGLTMYFLAEAVADHLHPTDFLKTCRRAVAGGESAYLFGELWPERRLLPSRNPLKRWLLPQLAKPRSIMPAMRFVAGSLSRFWCPNPLLLPTLLVHERYGYWREEARQAARTRPQIADAPGERSQA